ncbi:BQ2448_7643 [Microbotryum intermedium]|uniref:BQ2448_7643 protein n=1 Tax=Microbotryum intermedium TaxID=269621 RepID=A0A238FRY2_9BASI|nr:BQ2448_7643 [Microbotryum intermedium]
MSSSSSQQKVICGFPRAISTSTSTAWSSSSVLTPARPEPTASTSSHHLLDLTIDDPEEDPPIVAQTPGGPPRIDRNELRPILQQPPSPNRQVPTASFYSAASAPPALSNRISSNRTTTYRDSKRTTDRAWEVHHGAGFDVRSSSSDMAHGHRPAVVFGPQDPTMKGKSRPPTSYTAGNGGWSNSGPSSNGYSQSQHHNTGGRRRPVGDRSAGAMKILTQALQSAMPGATPSSRRNPTKALPTTKEPMPTQVAEMKKIGKISQGAPVDADPRRVSPETELVFKRTISQAAGSVTERRASSAFQVRGTAGDSTSKPPKLDVKGKGKAKADDQTLELSSDDEGPGQDTDDDIQGFDDEKPRHRSDRHGQPRASTSAAAAASTSSRWDDSRLNNKESSPDALALSDKAERSIFPRESEQVIPVVGPFARTHTVVGEGARHAQGVIAGQNIDVKTKASLINKMQPRSAPKSISSAPVSVSGRSVNGDGNPSNDLIIETARKAFVPARRNKPKEDITSAETMSFVVEVQGISYGLASTGDCKVMHNSKGPPGSQQLTLRCSEEEVCCLRINDISGFEQLDDGQNCPILAIKLSLSATKAATKLSFACKFRRGVCTLSPLRFLHCQQGTQCDQIVVWLRFICEPIVKLREDGAVRRIVDLVTRDWPKYVMNKNINHRIDASFITSSSAMKARIEMYDKALHSGRSISRRRQSAGFAKIESAASTLSNSPRTRQTSNRDGSGSGEKRGESPQQQENRMISIGQRAKRVPRKSAEAARGRISEATADTVDEQYAWQIEEDGTPLEKTVLVYPLQGDKTVVSVTHGDTKRLVDGKYLNDTLIEFGLKRAFLNLVDRDSKLVEGSKPLAPLVHMFNSFFYKKLDRRGLAKQQTYDSVAKWTSKFDLFEKKIVIVPINEKNHWYLAIVYNPGAILKGDVAVPKQTRKTRHSLLDKTDVMATESGASSPSGSATEPTVEQQNLSPPDLKEALETSRFFQNPRESKRVVKPTAFKTDISPMDVDAEFVEETPEEDSRAMEIDEFEDDAELYNGEGVAVKADLQKDGNGAATKTETVLLDGEVTLASMPNRGAAPEPAQLSLGEVLASSSDTDAGSARAVEKALLGPTANVNLSAPSSAQPGKALRRTPTPISPSTRPPGTRTPPPPPPPPRRSEDGATLNNELTIANSDNEAAEVPLDVTERCYIMTFDSLGDAHRLVGKNLRDYLRREALAKKGLDISENWIDAHAEAFAVDVPQQDNCSDCGLYLIHFVEQFLVDPDDRLRYILRYRGDRTRAEKGKDSSKEDRAIQLQKLLRQRDLIWKGAAAKSKRGELREEVKMLAEQWAEIRRPLEEEEARKRQERAARKAEEREARMAAELAQTRVEHGDDMADLPGETKATNQAPSTRAKRTLVDDDAPVVPTRVEEVQREKTPKATSEAPDAVEGISSGENGKISTTYGKKCKAAAGKSGKEKKKEAQEIILSSGDESNEPTSSPPKRIKSHDTPSVSIGHTVAPPRAPRRNSTRPTPSESVLRASVMAAVTAAPTEATTSTFKKPSERLDTFPAVPSMVVPVTAGALSIPTAIVSSQDIDIDEAFQMINKPRRGAPDPDLSLLEIASTSTTDAIQGDQFVLPPPSAPSHPSRSTRFRDEAESDYPNKRQAVSSELISAPALPANGSTVISGVDYNTPSTTRSRRRRVISPPSDLSDNEMEMPPSAQTPRAVEGGSKRVPRASLRHADNEKSTASPSNSNSDSNSREPEIVVLE